MWNHTVVIEKNPETQELEACCKNCPAKRTQSSVQQVNQIGYFALAVASLIGIFWAFATSGNNGNIPDALRGGPEILSAFGGLLLLMIGLFLSIHDLQSFKEMHEAGPR